MMSDYFATKYDSAAAEVIAVLSDELSGFGMRDDSSGDVEAPTGWFSLVTIPADVDLGSDDEVGDLAREYGVTGADVAGTFIVTHNSQGFVSVDSFESESAGRECFDALSAEYGEWLGDDED